MKFLHLASRIETMIQDDGQDSVVYTLLMSSWI